MFDPKGNFFHYDFQETKTTLENATEEQKNYRPPTTEDFVKQSDPKPKCLMRMISGVIDADTGDEYDFDGRYSNDFQIAPESAPESKSKGLIEKITDFVFRTDDKVTKLATPKGQTVIPPAQAPTTNDSAVMVPKNPPQTTGVHIVTTEPNIPFIKLLRSNSKRYIQDSSINSEIASFLS